MDRASEKLLGNDSFNLETILDLRLGLNLIAANKVVVVEVIMSKRNSASRIFVFKSVQPDIIEFHCSSVIFSKKVLTDVLKLSAVNASICFSEEIIFLTVAITIIVEFYSIACSLSSPRQVYAHRMD